jgi:hypothetical protein
MKHEEREITGVEACRPLEWRSGIASARSQALASPGRARGGGLEALELWVEALEANEEAFDGGRSKRAS